MRTRAVVTILLASLVPSIVAAQSAPVATAFRQFETTEAKNLVASAETMPADKYGFKPTAAQMTFGHILVHLSGGNESLCSLIAGTKAPAHAKLVDTDTKAQLIAGLKASFDYCNSALGGLDDSTLGDQVTMFGQKVTRADVILETAGDWSDHYSQMATYLRMNGQLPPTATPAKKP